MRIQNKLFTYIVINGLLQKINRVTRPSHISGRAGYQTRPQKPSFKNQARTQPGPTITLKTRARAWREQGKIVRSSCLRYRLICQARARPDLLFRLKKKNRPCWRIRHCLYVNVLVHIGWIQHLGWKSLSWPSHNGRSDMNSGGAWPEVQRGPKKKKFCRQMNSSG